MVDARLAAVRASLHADSWRRQDRNREQVFVWNAKPEVLLPPDLGLVDARRSAGPLNYAASHGKLTSTRASGELGVRFDIFELADDAAALDMLVELAAEFHLPVPVTSRLDDVGDVCVATQSNTWLGFVRGNLLVRLMQDRAEADLLSLAREIDGTITSRPESAESGEESLSLRAAAAPSPEPPAAAPAVSFDLLSGSGQAFVRPISNAAATEQPCIKIFSRGGSICSSQRLQILRGDAKRIEADVYVIARDGRATHRHHAVKSDRKRSTKEDPDGRNGEGR